jgi:hypothetical protein
VRGKVFHSLIVKGIKLLLKELVLENGGWNVLFSFLKLYTDNFGIRKFNIFHCQLRNEVSNLKAHLFNDFFI